MSALVLLEKTCGRCRFYDADMGICLNYGEKVSPTTRACKYFKEI